LKNPLLDLSDLPNYAAITAEQVTPAIDELLKKARTDVHKLVESGLVSYAALMEAKYKILTPLNRAWGVVNHLKHVMSNESLREAYNVNLEKVTQFYTELSQDKGFYQALEKIDREKLRPDQRKALENELVDFELAGVGLEGEQRERSAIIFSKLSELGSAFSDAVLDATMAWTKTIVAVERLKGLPQSALDLLAQNAAQRGLEGYLLTLEFPSYLPIMTYCDDRELRKELSIARMSMASEVGPDAGKFDNTQRMEEIMQLRQEYASILGFKHYSELSLKRKMAKSPEQVLQFLNDLVERSRPAAERELQEVIDFAMQRDGLSDLQAWDLAYYREKLKERDYQLSEEDLKPYFPIEKVIEGMFSIVEHLFELNIEQVKTFEAWHEDVRFYEIKRGERQVARFFLDPFARQHKQGGAWMDSCKPRRKFEGEDLQTPVAYLVCNFTPPVGDKPSLLTHDEVTTLFHEFGHGLHHMLTVIDDPNVAGIGGVAWDAVELPSQFLENWCWQRETIPMISGHYETGAPLPEVLLDKMLKAKNFQSAAMMLRQLEFSLFDFRLHMAYGKPDFVSIKQLIAEVKQKTALIKPCAEDRFQNSFTHIFSGGYDAGYYSYKWAEVLSADAFSKFEEDGVMNVATGRDFLTKLLSQGGSRDAAELFESFRGREPAVDALLRHSGII